MAATELKATMRTSLGSANSRRERNEGQVPAVVYGHGSETLSVSVNALELNRILASETGANTLIALDIDGKKDTALARQIKRHPTKPQITHVDFIRVNVNEEVVAEVTLHLEGEPEGVKDGGRLEQIHFTLTVKAKPADIPVSLSHDISAMTIGGHLEVGEIVLPSGVTSEQEADTVVAVISVPRGKSDEEAAEGAEGEAAEGDVAATASTEGESKDKE
ncbi:MAG: 50S ribosomal protein L25 [Acidimicrobiia bacterium]